MKLTNLFFLLTASLGLSLIPESALRADSTTSYPIMFRPQDVQMYTDMPADLAQKYPKACLVMITFKPLDHAAAPDGANVGDGEGGWLDRGMNAREPGKIRFLLPEDDPNLITHTLKVSDGPFILHVRNTNAGYLETVPLFSPTLTIADSSADKAPPAAPPSGASLTTEQAQDGQVTVISSADHSRVPLINVGTRADGITMDNPKEWLVSQEVHISDDSHWILEITTWSHHNADLGVNAYLYEKIQDAPLKLKLVPGHQSFAKVAFNLIPKSKTDTAKLIRFVAWKPNTLSCEATITSSDYSQTFWSIDYDLPTGKFSNPVKERVEK